MSSRSFSDTILWISDVLFPFITILATYFVTPKVITPLIYGRLGPRF